MAVQTTYPGVYIDEFTPGAPIEGVGTSTAAFVGLASHGDLNAPIKLTSWDGFTERYGRHPRPGFFLWYSVRGFFENGGQVCYVVRASNGAHDRWDVPDRSGDPASLAFHLTARRPGTSNIALDVGPRSLLPAGAEVYHAATATTAAGSVGRSIVIGAGEGAQFRPGDLISITNGTGTLQVVRVTPGAASDTLRVGSDPEPGAPAAGETVTLAGAVGDATRTIRLTSPVNPLPQNALVPGTMLTVDATAQAGGGTDTQVVEAVQVEQLGGGAVTYRVTFREPLRIGFGLDPADAAVDVRSEEFDVVVTQGASVRTYTGLAMDPLHPHHFLAAINGDEQGLLRAERVQPPPPVVPPLNLPEPAVGPAVAVTITTNGADEDLATFADNDFIAAIDTLREVDDVNLVAVPDCLGGLAGVNAEVVHDALIRHCEQLGDRFAVLDARPGLELFANPTTDSIDAQRDTVDSARGYAALYYPWLQVRPAGAGDPILVPPSGHVCGIFARSDGTRGVHKAPANEIVSGALGVERTMSDVDQGQLNLRGINVIRVFSSAGRPVLWGARTTATNRSWQYVNVRRLFLFLEESIQEGIRWAVFEPNGLSLWQQLRRTITDFLTRAWRDGALFGETPEDAFYVRIDEVLNPFSEQALGRLHIEIGVRPTYPAEFIIVRIGIWPGGSEITEA